MAENELHRLIQLRVDGFFTRMWLHLGAAVLLLLLLAMILGLVFFVARQIALPIRRLARVAQEVRETGDHIDGPWSPLTLGSTQARRDRSIGSQGAIGAR